MAYSFVVTFIIAKVIDGKMGLRIEKVAERVGLDRANTQSPHIRHDVDMRLITAAIKPFKLDEVKDALKKQMALPA